MDMSDLAIPKPVKRQKVPKGLKARPVKRDGVSGELRMRVLRRDGICLAKLHDPEHQCKDKFGGPMTSTDLSKLQFDHVWPDGGHMGSRAPDSEQTATAMCPDVNVKGASRELRVFQRAYLAKLYDLGDGLPTS